MGNRTNSITICRDAKSGDDADGKHTPMVRSPPDQPEMMTESFSFDGDM